MALVAEAMVPGTRRLPEKSPKPPKVLNISRTSEAGGLARLLGDVQSAYRQTDGEFLRLQGAQPTDR